MRISTSELFRNGVGNLQAQQAELARVQEQLATGKRMLAPSDDPAGAVQALKLKDRIAELDQFSRNADFARTRLGQSEAVLEQMGQSLQRVRELTVQAANATQTNESRSAIGRELRQLADGLVDVANTRDANGEYLFAGFRSATQPFARGADGAVQYLGDSGQRRLALAPDRTLPVADSGLAFMTVPQGNGAFVVEPGATNAGTGRAAVMEVTDPRIAAGGAFEIRFPSAERWEAQAPDGTVLASGPMAADTAIEIGGRRIVIAGTPAAGDGFQVAPAGQVSVFEVVDDLAARLAAPAGSPAERARLAHDLDMALRSIDQAFGRVLEVRTEVGARLNAVDSQITLNQDQALRVRTVLSGIEDLDYAEAVSRFQLRQVALQAAQQTYVQLSRLSLFDYIR